jgi:hypothetical protein
VVSGFGLSLRGTIETLSSIVTEGKQLDCIHSGGAGYRSSDENGNRNGGGALVRSLLSFLLGCVLLCLTSEEDPSNVVAMSQVFSNEAVTVLSRCLFRGGDNSLFWHNEWLQISTESRLDDGVDELGRIDGSGRCAKQDEAKDIATAKSLRRPLIMRTNRT